ncbi:MULTISPECIES: MFS transporter [unclassified Massilia]|uniref:MFS transporter n=1 Tax=unclassified Massilia TaxID=2609279 RepID=UPI001783FDE1|nr:MULTISPECIES: MFS transporter [unclassified Massilia]MBD8530135.1 MFS transporter [Massilia sp. CFBP 13647]MBD8674036.1 MFS transporter [Massilia sp. CFBP 13721]
MTTLATPSADTASQPAVSPWPTFWIACIAVFLVSIDSTVLFAAFGALQAAFPAATPADLSWVLNAYTVVYATMLIPAGGLADAHGRKRVFLFGVTLFLAASAACGMADSVAWLIVARVLQALGAALLTPASLSIILDAFPKEKRAVAVSLWGAVGGLAAAIGPSLGTTIVEHLGWPWAFYINLPLGAVSLWFGAARLREAVVSGKRARVDLVGMLLLIVAVGAVAMAITQLDSPRWSRLELAALAATSAIAFGAFVAWARTAAAPLVDLALFANRSYSAVNLATLAFGTAFAMMFFAFFAYMTHIWHFSLPLAGLAVTPGPLMVVPTAIVAGRIAARKGHRPLLVTGSLVYAASGLWLLLVPGTEPAYVTDWLPGLFLSGIGVGMVLPSLSGAAVAGLPQAQYAVGSAVNQATRQLGSVLGVAITVLLVGHAGVTRADFLPLYGMHVVLALVTGALCLAVKTRPAPR